MKSVIYKSLLFFLAIVLLTTFGNAQVQCGQATDEPPGCLMCSPVYLGNTGGYTAGVTIPGFCDATHNNQWLSVQANASTIILDVSAFNCSLGLGGVVVQMCDVNYTPISNCIINSDLISTVTATGLTPGEVYYIMIDGFAGDICDFYISIVQGVNFSPPAVPGTIVHDSPNLLCPGAISCFSVPPITNSHTIEWDIPANGTIISGAGTTDICVEWNAVGGGVVCVTGNNGCYNGVPSCGPAIIVQEIPPVVFPPVSFCKEDFPVIIDGREFANAGRHEFHVPSYRNCDSTIVYVLSEYPILPGHIDTLLCAGDSVLVNGLYYSQSGSYSLILPEASVHGCDSVFSLNIDFENVAIPLIANPGFLECRTNTSLQLDASMSTSFPNSVYEWRSLDGHSIQVQGNGNAATVFQPGLYTLKIVDPGNTNCQELVDTVEVKHEIIAPLQLDSVTSIICVDDDALYRVFQPLNVDSIVWRFDTLNEIVTAFGDTSLFYQWPTAGAFHLEVFAKDSCRNGDLLDTVIQVMELADNDFMLDKAQICYGEVSNLSISNYNPLATYTWNLNGASLIHDDNNGQLVIDFPNPGIFILELETELNGCLSGIYSQAVDVLSALSSPVISCNTTANSMIFEWDDVADAVTYTVNVLTGQVGNLGSNQFLIDNLGPSEDVEIEVVATGICGSSNSSLSCTTPSCPNVNINYLGNLSYCEDESPVNLDFEILGGDGTGVTQINGSAINQAGMFDPSLIGPGMTDIVIEYSEGLCSWSETINISIESNPHLSAEVHNSIWYAEMNGAIDLSVLNGVNNYYQWDNGEITEDLNGLSPGRYCVDVVSPNNCKSEACYDLGQGLYRLNRVHVICEGEGTELSIRPNRGASFDWSPSFGLSCTDCPNPYANPNTFQRYIVRATLANGRFDDAEVWVIVLPRFFCGLAPKLQDEIINNELSLAQTKDLISGQILVYPNPVKDEVILNSIDGIENIEILNANGKRLYHSNEVLGLSTTVQTGDLPSGVYFLKVKTRHKTIVEKFLKI